MSVGQPVVDEWVYYPETDGQPMAETDTHCHEMAAARLTLEDFYRHEPNVYVSGNLLLYYVEGDPGLSVAPDVMVVRGIPKGERRVYKLWEEGKGPDVVIEVTSKWTQFEDVNAKKALYEQVLQAPEYFLFDPLHHYLRAPLIGYRLVKGKYRALVSKQPGRLVSRELGLELVATDQGLRFYDPVQGAFLLTPDENAEARREAEAKVQAAEIELERLRAERERLRGKKSKK